MIHYDILNKKRKNLLPNLKVFKKDFYLAGGTALALQIGHRDSQDFDFFSKKHFKNKELFAKVKKAFRGHEIVREQEKENTLHVLIDNALKT